LTESEEVDGASIFSNTVTSLIAEPVAAILRSIEQTRSALGEAMQLAASVSGREVPDELPKLAGMPMVDLNEISQKIVIEKPDVFSLLGKGMLTSHVQRKLETKYDRTLLEFLSFYANRLRRWMEQSINALRNAFAEFADMHRAHFEVALVYRICQPSRGIFEFCVNGRILRTLPRSAARKFPDPPEKSQTNNPVPFENWKLRVIHARS
jgi:hypothetical protein